MSELKFRTFNLFKFDVPLFNFVLSGISVSLLQLRYALTLLAYPFKLNFEVDGSISNGPQFRLLLQFSLINVGKDLAAFAFELCLCFCLPRL